MRNKLYIILTVLFACMAIVACQWSLDRGWGGDAVDDIKVHRYDKLQDEYFRLNSFSALQEMNTEYAQETKLLIEDVLAIGAVSDENINQYLREYYSDTLLQSLRRDAMALFDDMGELERLFTRGFSKLKKELPQITIPRVYAQISALSQSVVVGDSILGFSIDKYMGADYPLYDHFYYPYQCRSMSSERIVPDCFKYYLLSEYPFPWEWHRTLLDHIVHRGKIHWVVSYLLECPTLEAEIGYTKEEGDWCKARKDSIWDNLIQSGHLHSTDPMFVRVYLQPSECTYPLGKDAPGEVGVWLGIHIVDEYMKKNPDVTIAQLLRETDYRAVLKNLQMRY